MNLWRTREVKWMLAAYASTAVVCAFLPLADHLGFEFAAILTLVAAVAAPFAGFSAMRADGALEPEERRPARAAARAGAIAVAALVLPAGIVLLNGVRRPVCDPAAGTVWLFLLAAPTAWLSATCGALARLLVSRPRSAVIMMAVVELASFLVAVGSAYFGPALFGFDHFWGYFPGLSHDVTIPVTLSLVSFRTVTVLLGVAAVTTAGAMRTGDRLARRMHAAWAIALVAACLIVSARWGHTLGWRTTDRSLRAALSGEVRVDRLVLHFPRDWSDRAVEELVRDAAFDAAEVQRALGLKSTEPIHVWMYGSSAQKRRLVGASSTQFAKPYRHEIHVDPGGYPHPVLRHELVHAMAAELAGGVWRTPGRIIPNAALTEGLAVAFDLDDGTLTPTQEARAMRDLGLAPNLETLLTPGGFLTESSTRAYAYAGAFIRYLAGRFDTDQLHRLYRTGELRALGEPGALIRDFGRMLDTVTTDANARSTSARRNAQASIFRRSCAREVEVMVDSAFALAINRQGDLALAMFDRACALQPSDPALVRDKLGVAIRMRPNNPQQIREIAATLWAHPSLDPALEAASRLMVGDELWRQRDAAGARAEYERAAVLPMDPESRRAVRIRLRAMSDSSLSSLVMPFYADDGARLPMLLRMADALPSRPRDALLRYVAGRQWFARGADAKAVELLQDAAAIGLQDADFTRSAFATLVIAYARQHRCDDADRARASLEAAGGSLTERAIAGDWAARCRFAMSRGWKVIQ